MLKLNDARIEIQIKSPSELIARLEKFIDPKERFKEESFEGTNIVIMGQTIAESVYVVLTWKPEFDEDGKITNL